ncbi:MAG: hypothetical protein PHW11_04950 [Anaerolineaceae bacterium]|nr:hypothetical protein [Anaerolineaceae bacterium]MDD4042078.1 hypothetical protein [Anaerolineaceae bacterium]MDD4578097.1 hypothetical protein [Anaerolineaceae bacterium]
MVTTRFDKRFLLVALGLLLALIAILPANPTHAQTYRFTLPTYEVEAYIEEDGSVTLIYIMVFENDPSASPIDFVDLALPYANYDLREIVATIDGQPMPEVNNSAYVSGAELALKNLAIQPGASGTVIATVPGVTDILFPYDQGDRENYINFQFTPNYFGSDFDRSQNTEYRMTIILPPAVGAEEGVYYIPRNWPGEDISEASFTQDNRVYYSWFTNNADVHTEYEFGAAFPASAVPAGVIADPGDYEEPGSSSGGGSGIGGFISALLGGLPCIIPILFVIGFGIFARKNQQKSSASRKLQYFPPKLAVDGKGIRRGLTAAEAGILLEEPLDNILTMVLFGLLKKEAIMVVEKEPLTIKPNEPLPEGLYDYETQFIAAFAETDKNKQRRSLQAMLIELVDVVQEKMKGFSPDETKAYYKDIVRRAWLAVEGAETPEIKSAQYDHTLEWTMLDDQFNNRTQQTFINTPVFLPRWWGLYNPGFAAAPATGGSGGLASPVSSVGGGGSSKPSISMPNIPGSDFAASIINGATAFSAGVVGDLTGFTSAVTNRTNPIPISRPTSGSSGFRGGGGGSSCACACACAGCACACAGGGR